MAIAKKIVIPKYLGAIGLFYKFEKDEIYIPTVVMGACSGAFLLSDLNTAFVFIVGIVSWLMTFRIYRYLKERSARGAWWHFLYYNSLVPPISKSKQKNDPELAKLLRKRKIVSLPSEKEFIT
jgi:hypothetical protein